MDLTSVKGLRDLTKELIKTHRELFEPEADPRFSQLWSVVEQELLRYSCTLADDCDSALRELVTQGVDRIGELEAAGKLGFQFLRGKPRVVITPNIYPHLGTEPVRYLIYGLHVHPSRQEERAETALRTLVLSMITTAKEGESDELTLQTLGQVKSRLCPWWPFWEPEDC